MFKFLKKKSDVATAAAGLKTADCRRWPGTRPGFQTLKIWLIGLSHVV